MSKFLHPEANTRWQACFLFKVLINTSTITWKLFFFFSRRITGWRADGLLKSTQRNTLFCQRKQGNHGDDIFQAGESLDRHAFEAPFVCSRRWMWDSSEFVSTHVGKGGSSRRGAESINAITWSETQVTTHFAHTANINRTLCACEEQCWHVRRSGLFVPIVLLGLCDCIFFFYYGALPA